MSESTHYQACDVCQRQARLERVRGSGVRGDAAAVIECPWCGRYAVPEPYVFRIKTSDRFAISVHLRTRSVRGWSPGYLVHDGDEEMTLDGFQTVTPTLAARSFPRAVGARLEEALLNIAAQWPHFGEVFPLEEDDGPLLFAEDEPAQELVVDELLGAGLLGSGSATFAPAYRLTARGWDTVSRLQRGPLQRDSNNVFVAMSFAPALQETYDGGIRPGIEAAGYRAVRLDEVQHNGLIDDRLLAEIRSSQFLVAELTTQNRGAYFEAGYAKGSGLDVIYVIREDDLKECHFDTSHYSMIVWSTPEELRTRLRDRIIATIGFPSTPENSTG